VLQRRPCACARYMMAEYKSHCWSIDRFLRVWMQRGTAVAPGNRQLLLRLHDAVAVLLLHAQSTANARFEPRERAWFVPKMGQVVWSWAVAKASARPEVPDSGVGALASMF
jgi:hypothetical protein